MTIRSKPFDFVPMALAVFDICRRRMESIGYKDGNIISHEMRFDETPNACANAIAHEPIQHKIFINEGLVKRLYDVSRAFSDTSLLPEAAQAVSARHALHQIVFKVGSPDVNTFIYRLALAFVYFHETGHLNQQHKKFRDSLQCEPDGFPFSELDEDANAGDTMVTGIESARRQTMELMADYEGVIRTLEFIKALSIDPAGKLIRDTTALVWQGVVAICLVFYIFRGEQSHRSLMPIQGIHPNPATRMLMIAMWIADYVKRDPDHFPGLTDAEYSAACIEEALISAGQFWYTFQKAPGENGQPVALPVMHEEMRLSADFHAWQEEIALAWTAMAQPLNQQRVCKGVPLPTVIR